LITQFWPDHANSEHFEQIDRSPTLRELSVQHVSFRIVQCQSDVEWSFLQKHVSKYLQISAPATAGAAQDRSLRLRQYFAISRKL
jgi:hypothetical protein